LDNLGILQDQLHQGICLEHPQFHLHLYQGSLVKQLFQLHLGIYHQYLELHHHHDLKQLELEEVEQLLLLSI
jgi:hypothetical protein